MSKKILKRSLALGALMAFVITGNTFAGNLKNTKYHQLEGKSDDIKVNLMNPVEDYITNSGERLIGGWYSVGENDKVTAVNTEFKVTGGEFGYVVGGNWNQTIGTASTNIVIDGANVKVKQVYAGTAFSVGETNENAEIPFLKDGTEGRNTSLLILSGTFGGEKDNTNCVEMVVAGGDFLKSFAQDIPTYDKVETYIESTNVEIRGGTFNAAVLGGSVANRAYASNGTGSIVKSTVNNANITITGGKFYDAIVAGGAAWGHNTESTVNNAVLNISGSGDNKLIFGDNADVYAGGLVDWKSYNVGTYDNGETDGALVKKTTIDIKNAKVSDIYGTDGYIKSVGNVYAYEGDWEYHTTDEFKREAQAVNTDLTLINVDAQTVDVPLGTVTVGVENKGNTSISMLSLGNKVGLAITVDGETNDAINGDARQIAAANYITIGNAADGLKDKVTTVTLEAGEATDTIILTSDDKGGFNKEVIKNEGNTGISDISSVALMAWRAETNDMNKRMGELRNANGEHGVWVRMVRGESEYNSVKNQYNQYQLGYDEKLSVDKSWTVGMALSYTDAESSFGKGSGENTHKGLAIYGSKLNDDGSFVDLIAKYSRLEHDFDLGNAKGDYDTNGYSVSAEYGKRFQQGNGMWIEPQVELTYGQVDSATYMVGGRTVDQEAMESLVGRVGFSLGKDIKQGNVYARASYLCDFEGETEARFAADASGQTFEQDLGGGWWEVGVGANINLSKATYIYADVEKTFGGEVDTNWQWNLGVRYSF